VLASGEFQRKLNRSLGGREDGAMSTTGAPPADVGVSLRDHWQNHDKESFKKGKEAGFDILGQHYKIDVQVLYRSDLNVRYLVFFITDIPREHVLDIAASCIAASLKRLVSRRKWRLTRCAWRFRMWLGASLSATLAS
jgi:hypothetical protein